jgi:hypothetical protein
MGAIKLQKEPLKHTVKKVASQGANNAFASVMTLITLVCNSTTARYGQGKHPRVKVTKADLIQSFLYDTGAQQSCMPFKAFVTIYCSGRPQRNAEQNIYKGTYIVLMELESVQDHILCIDFINTHLWGTVLPNRNISGKTN